MYKTLGVRWLLECFCPASAFATADSDEARNPQRFIHVTVSCNPKRHPANIDSPTKNRQKSQRFVKLKEVQANTQRQRFCTTFNFTPTHPSPPTTLENNIVRQYEFKILFVYLRTI